MASQRPDSALTLPVLVELVRAAIFPDCSADIPVLSPARWEAVFEESQRQTVAGIALRGISRITDAALMPPQPLLIRWVALADRIERTNRHMASAISKLFDFYAAAGLPALLQKGHSVARFYPQPLLRQCGDIDVVIPPARAAEAIAAVGALGIPVEVRADGSRLFSWDGFTVEHHTRLLDLSRPLPPALSAEAIPAVASPEATLPPLIELLMLNSHIMKHCLGAGIGLRQMCDYALALRALLPVVGQETYTAACRSLGIARWTRALDSFTDAWFGPRPASPSRDASALMAVIAEGGNFGLHGAGGSRRGRGLRSRLATAAAFLRHSGLALRLAPRETLATVAMLLKRNAHYALFLSP